MLLKAICLKVVDDVISNINFSKKDTYFVQNWRNETTERLISKSKKIEILYQNVKKDEDFEIENKYDKKIIELIDKNIKEKELNSNEIDILDVLFAFIVDLCNDYDNYKINKKEIYKWLSLKVISSI
jgi:hypothetical protein